MVPIFFEPSGILPDLQIVNMFMLSKMILPERENYFHGFSRDKHLLCAATPMSY